MSRDDGLRRADLDVNILSDPKFRKLARSSTDDGVLGRCVTAYLSILTGSWSAGERLPLEDVAPAWLGGLADLEARLINVGLLDNDRLIPQKAWTAWYEPTAKAMQAKRERWARANEQRRQRRKKGLTARSPRGSSAATATSPSGHLKVPADREGSKAPTNGAVQPSGPELCPRCGRPIESLSDVEAVQRGAAVVMAHVICQPVALSVVS